MRPVEKWIWLPESVYPKAQTTRYSWQAPENPEPEYAVAAFWREYRFDKVIEKVHLRFSGDTAFALFCNGEHLANGPVLPGGDFLAIYGREALPSTTPRRWTWIHLPVLMKESWIFMPRCGCLPVGALTFPGATAVSS